MQYVAIFDVFCILLARALAMSEAEHGVQDSRIHGDNSFDTIIGRGWGK